MADTFETLVELLERTVATMPRGHTRRMKPVPGSENPERCSTDRSSSTSASNSRTFSPSAS